MKKTYEKPTVETVKFQYRDQVVVASSSTKYCGWTWYENETEGVCQKEINYEK